VNRREGVTVRCGGHKFPPPASGDLGVPSVPSRYLPRFLHFPRRTEGWIWHGFGSGFGFVFTEVGTEGTSLKFHPKKQQDFFVNPR